MKNKKSFLMLSILCSSTFLSPIVLAKGTDEDTTQPSVEVNKDTLTEEVLTSNSEGSVESTNDSLNIESSDSSVEVSEDSSMDEQVLTDLENESNDIVTVEPHAEPNEYTELGDSAFYKYDESTKTLTLKGTIENNTNSVYSLASQIPGISDVKHIVVDEMLILSGGMGGFCQDLINLESIEAPKIDVSNVTYMLSMFYNASSLTSLDLSNWDTSSVTNMAMMFTNASSLTSLDLSNWDTSSVTNMASMFFDARSLTSLDLDNWDTSSVTNMVSVFANARGLTSLNLSNWDTSSVTDMRNMFANARGLTSLDLNNWDTSSVTKMGSMFSYATGLTSLNLNNWDTSSVTDMRSIFDDANSLTSLDLNNWDTSSVTDMAYMFSGMMPLDTLILGPLFKANDNVKLFEKTSAPYTGRWLLAGNEGISYTSSGDFMNNYEGTYPGTYYREQEKESSSTESTSSSSSETESSSTESTSSSSSETESSSTESTSSSSSETESSSTESTSSSSSETESSSTESTSSSSSEELTPVINVSDKTMYVGDKLTEEDILNWATFENADGLKVGFEVINDEIPVYKSDSTLAKAGSYKIKYYVEDKDGKIIEEKTITLTVKDKATSDTTSSTTSIDSTGTSNNTNTSGTYTKPVGKTTPIKSASTTAGLPQTGETNSPMLTVVGTMTLLASGAYVLNLKRKKSN